MQELSRYNAWISLSIFLFLFSGCKSGEFFRNHSSSVEIPFEVNNNFIILTFSVNGLSDSKFIFDTGSENSLFFEKSVAELMGFRMVREVKIMGSDLTQEIRAYIAIGVKFNTINNEFKGDILVLDEDIFRLDEYFGFRVSGIIGNNMFKNKQVEIDFDKRVLRLYEEHPTPPLSSYTLTESIWQNGKPYVFPKLVSLPTDSALAVKLLFDTGATLGLLIYNAESSGLSYPSSLIPGNLGMGIGGPIKGYIGRIHSVELGDFKLNNLVTHFHALDSTLRMADKSKKDGILGNGIISKFNVYLDYVNSKVYLKPNKSYSLPVTSDRSGMLVISGGINLDQFIVREVIAISPAAEADIRPGDIIQKVNGFNVKFMTLSQLNGLLSNPKREKVRLILMRGAERLERVVLLRDLI